MLWLNEGAEPRFGMRDSFLGVANRRRIWTVCGLVADAYDTQLGQGHGVRAASTILQQ